MCLSTPLFILTSFCPDALLASPSKFVALKSYDTIPSHGSRALVEVYLRVSLPIELLDGAKDVQLDCALIVSLCFLFGTRSLCLCIFFRPTPIATCPSCLIERRLYRLHTCEGLHVSQSRQMVLLMTESLSCPLSSCLSLNLTYDDIRAITVLIQEDILICEVPCEWVFVFPSSSRLYIFPSCSWTITGHPWRWHIDSFEAARWCASHPKLHTVIPFLYMNLSLPAVCLLPIVCPALTINTHSLYLKKKEPAKYETFNVSHNKHGKASTLVRLRYLRANVIMTVKRQRV